MVDHSARKIVYKYKALPRSGLTFNQFIVLIKLFLSFFITWLIQYSSMQRIAASIEVFFFYQRNDAYSKCSYLEKKYRYEWITDTELNFPVYIRNRIIKSFWNSFSKSSAFFFYKCLGIRSNEIIYIDWILSQGMLSKLALQSFGAASKSSIKAQSGQIVKKVATPVFSLATTGWEKRRLIPDLIA